MTSQVGLGFNALDAHVSICSGLAPGIVAVSPFHPMSQRRNSYQTARYTYQLAVRLRGGVATYMIVRMSV